MDDRRAADALLAGPGVHDLDADHRAVARDEVVFVETTHPSGSVHVVTWRLDGAVVANDNRRNLDLDALGLSPGNHTVTASVGTETPSWTVDNTLPTAPRTLSTPLTSLPGGLEHNVYFGEFDMALEPQDDQPGFVVGEVRLNRDGWFNYFGFPEQPEGTPFTFSHSGKDVKALTYGNLGTGGLSKATFEQSFTDAHPSGGFEPGYGTHTAEHRAIDAAGNIGDAESFRATVLPGGSPACTNVVLGTRNGGLRERRGGAAVCRATPPGRGSARDGSDGSNPRPPA